MRGVEIRRSRNKFSPQKRSEPWVAIPTNRIAAREPTIAAGICAETRAIIWLGGRANVRGRDKCERTVIKSSRVRKLRRLNNDLFNSSFMGISMNLRHQKKEMEPQTSWYRLTSFFFLHPHVYLQTCCGNKLQSGRDHRLSHSGQGLIALYCRVVVILLLWNESICNGVACYSDNRCQGEHDSVL